MLRRFLLPLFVAALWLTAFVGGAAARCECTRACCAAMAVPEAQKASHACCHAKTPTAEAKSACARHGQPGCDQCGLKAKPKAQVLAQVVNAPVFFAATGPVVPVVLPVGGSRTAAVLADAWTWSLPPPDTLFSLGCQLLV